MKKIICYSSFLLGFIGYPQQTISFVLYSDYVKPHHFTVGLSAKDINKNTYALSVFNQYSQMNDNYVGVNGDYTKTNIQSAPIYFYGYGSIPMDSFNPYGSTNMKCALISGALNNPFAILGLISAFAPDEDSR